MHTQSWAREIPHSLPIEVEFAGFRSDTLRLAKAGWDISADQVMEPYHGDIAIRLALKHGGSHLYGITETLRIPREHFYSAAGNAFMLSQFLMNFCFHVQHVGNDILFRVQPERIRGMTFSRQFEPIDPFPQERVRDESIREFKFFKVAKPSIRDIIVSPDQVPELLDMVLRAQKLMLDGVKTREKSRSNLEQFREDMRGVKPAHQIQAQIITLAG